MPPSRPLQDPMVTDVPDRDEVLDSSESEASDDDGDGEPSGENLLSQDADSPAGSTPSASTVVPGKPTPTGDTPTSAPVQKRRRVTRACDECRRKKIKCDGKQPCTHCQVYSYECTYDKPSNRRRNPAPQYIEALEAKLQRAETLLRKFIPDVDLNDPSLDPVVQQEFRMRERARAQTAAASQKEEAALHSPNRDSQLRSMIESIGQLDLDEKGDYDFHGVSSAAVFFKRMKEHFKGLLGKDYQMSMLAQSSKPSSVFSLDNAHTAATPPSDTTLSSVYELPPKEVARALCMNSLDYATCLIRIVHRPTFYEMLDSIYSKGQHENFGIDDNRNLALFYSVLALGCMYNIPEGSDPNSGPYKRAIEEGLKYYANTRLLLGEITECRDLTSLQALLFMILFLQAISNLSTCYAFVGIALRSALRMGLHRNLPHASINPIEDETRKRVFYVCRQLDTYVSALLGFPILLREDDVDQPLPAEVDDEYITKDGIQTPPPEKSSVMQAFNAHCKLMDILARVIRDIYPLKGVEAKTGQGGQTSATYMISYAKIKEAEQSLHEWYEKLPTNWRPNNDGPDETVRVRQLLRFAYAHVQLVLFRPFLHYVSSRLSAGKNIDERAYACAAAAISISRNIIHISLEMRKQRKLIGPYWFTLFTEFFAILSLLFFAIENQDKPGSAEVLEDAIAGKDMIAGLARQSMAATRISKSLNVLWAQIPERLLKMKAKSGSSKKRSAPQGGRSGSIPIQPQPVFHRGSPMRSTSKVLRPNKSGGPEVSERKADTPQPNSQPAREFTEPVFPYNYTGVHGMGYTPSPEPQGLMGSMTESQQHLAPNATVGMHPFQNLSFQSSDPLAYPNQPMVSNHPNASHHPQDPSQFYMPSVFDGIEGQLMGPVPTYLTPQGPQAFDYSPQMYDPTSVLAFQHLQPTPSQTSRPSQAHTNRRVITAQQQRDIAALTFANTPWGGLYAGSE